MADPSSTTTQSATTTPRNNAQAVERASFHVDGLDCAEEVVLLKRELENRAGIHELDFDVLNAKMSVRFDPAVMSPPDIVRHVAATGMTARAWQSRSADHAVSDRQSRVRLILTGASGVLMVAALAWHAYATRSVWAALGHASNQPAMEVVPLLSRLLYLASILCGLRYVAAKAWAALRRLRPDMNLLMTVAVAGAIVINEWFEAAMVTFLFALSLLLEHWSIGRARRAISALMDLTPPTARCKSDDGRLETLPIGDVAVGTVILVKAGERVPLDGLVSQGATSVDESPITGEANPVAKQPGDEVFAGTINQSAVVEVEVTRPVGETLLSRILHMVSEAQSRRAASEQWVEQFARYYTPAMIALAIAVAIVPPLLFNGDWQDWSYNGLVVLVIACPCALVISTPVTIVSGLTSAARNGVLIKGGRYLEAAGTLNAIAFDKTGTLTRGEPVVQHVVTFELYPKVQLLATAAILESQSTHPLARAILQHARLHEIDIVPPTDLRTLSGIGVQGTVNGQSCWIGNRRLVEQLGFLSPSVIDAFARMEAAGSTAVAVGDELRVYGLIACADAMRSESQQTVEQLRRAGIRHIVMLTGDNRTVAERIAKAAGVDEVHAELLPQDKVREVEKLRERFHTVGMVGDGINDAPALAASTLGIAMGLAGTDAAIETADVALMSDDLSKVPWLIDHARRALSIIRQNIYFALGLKLLFVALTLAGVASLWLAIAADTGASLLVIFNGLRLLKPGRESD